LLFLPVGEPIDGRDYYNYDYNRRDRGIQVARDSRAMRNQRETLRFPAVEAPGKARTGKLNERALINVVGAASVPRDPIGGSGSGSGMQRRASARRGCVAVQVTIGETLMRTRRDPMTRARMSHAAGSPFSAMPHGRTPSARRTGTR